MSAGKPQVKQPNCVVFLQERLNLDRAKKEAAAKEAAAACGKAADKPVGDASEARRSQNGEAHDRDRPRDIRSDRDRGVS